MKNTLAALILSSCSAMPAAAQQGCDDAAAMRAALAAKFGEAVLMRGMVSGTQILEVWGAPEAGTWTVLVIRADGTACLRAAGTDLAIIAPPRKGDPT